jgi:exocyst complex protein 7
MIESRFDHAEDVVVRWHLGYSERAKQQRIFECPKEEASTYLEAVDEVQNLLDQLSVQNKEQQPATLERAQNVIQLAMERLEEEFCHFLRRTVDMWIRISSLTPWQWLDHSEALSMTIIIIP